MTYTLRNTRELLQRLPDPAFFEQMLGTKIAAASPDLDEGVTIPTLRFLQQLTFEMTGLLIELGIYSGTPEEAHARHFPELNASLCPDVHASLREGLAEDATLEYAGAYKLLAKFRAAEPLCA